ncbi:DUF2802 domain-containing protein [Chitinimonas lacunae]|uniref:DUF2802 domain-containing protein n=1 Tax=Chitinimonas lacunae TaxID=1963018 RepID=A0ABV8MXP7_9NEIS
MNGISITWTQLLFAAGVVIAIYVAELLLFLTKSRRRPAEDNADLLADLDTLRDEVAVLRRELAALRARVEEQAGDSRQTEPESAYSQAIRLARQGLDSAAVAAGCGISRGEAELIVALYRASNRSL